MMEKIKAIVIGSSAGALDALSRILPELPYDYPIPIIVVVHVPPDKKSILAEIFQLKCELNVKEVEDKIKIEKGNIYFAPPDYHILIENNRSISLSTEEPVLFSRPSIDILFETAADVYGPEVVGVILSGANSDGAEGLKKIIDEGGTGIVQHPSESFSEEMPLAAIKACPQALVLKLNQIASYLKNEEYD